jgi:hypothetical protein
MMYSSASETIGVVRLFALIRTLAAFRCGQVLTPTRTWRGLTFNECRKLWEGGAPRLGRNQYDEHRARFCRIWFANSGI